MIAAHRRRHRFAVAALAVAAPGVLVAALCVRPPPTTMPALPASLARAAGVVDVALRSPGHRSPSAGTGLVVDLVVGSDASGAATAALTPRGPVAAPSVLVYWTEALPTAATEAGGATPDSNALPPDAVLLGALAGRATRRFTLPPARTVPGDLLLYSLGRDHIIGRVPLAPATHPGGHS